MVTSEGHIHICEEHVHAISERMRSFGRPMVTALAFEDEQGITDDVDEVDIVIDDEG